MYLRTSRCLQGGKCPLPIQCRTPWCHYKPALTAKCVYVDLNLKPSGMVDPAEDMWWAIPRGMYQQSGNISRSWKRVTVELD